MHSLDVLGTQVTEAQPAQKNLASTNNEESSFQRHFDREVSKRPSESKSHMSRDEPAYNNARTAHQRKEINQSDTSNDSSSGVDNASPDQLSAESINSAESTFESVSDEGQSVVASETVFGLIADSGNDLSTEELNQFSAPLINMHIEQAGYPSAHYFRLSQAPLSNVAPISVEPANLELVQVAKNTDTPEFLLPKTNLITKFNVEGSSRSTLTPESTHTLFSGDVQPRVNLQAEAAKVQSSGPELKTSMAVNIDASIENALSEPAKFGKSLQMNAVADDLNPFTERLVEQSTSLHTSAASSLNDKLTLAGNSAENTGRFSVNIQFGRADWNNGIAAKVAQMAAQNLNYAEIQLDPPELGPLQVRVQMNNDQAAVSFTAHSSQVRDALEQGNQRLRELFEAEGLNLVDVDVSDQQQENKDELDSEQTDDSQLASENEVESIDDNESTNVSSVLQVGVDDFV